MSSTTRPTPDLRSPEPRATESRDLIDRWLEIVNRGALDRLGEVWAPACVVHAGGGIPAVHGIQALGEVLGLYRAALPDLTVSAEDVVVEGDRIAARFTTRGTHRGELLGVPPTGTSVVMGGFAIFRMRDGRFAEEWLLDDLVAFLAQTGAFPGPAAP